MIALVSIKARSSGKAQILVTDLEQLRADAKPGERKLRICARGEHQVHISRWMIEKREQGVVNGLLRDHMIVVQDEDELSVHLLQLIEECGQDGRERRRLWRV